MAKNSPYRKVWVESYRTGPGSGLHGQIHIRPLPDQGVPTTLHVECSKAPSDPDQFPLGTRFLLKAKLTDREGAGEFLYSYFGWKPIEVRKPRPNKTGV